MNSIVGNNDKQVKDNYRFSVDNSSELNPIDWYNAYLEVDFKLVKTADGAGFAAGTAKENACTTTNGHTFIKEVQVECNVITVYNNTRANESSNVLSLLKYTKSYADTIGQDQFFYLDTSTGTVENDPTKALYNEGFDKRKKLTNGGVENKISIPLNIYSYFAAFKNNLQPNIKTNIILKIEDDNNIVFRLTEAGDSKVILTKLRLWCPKIVFNGKGYEVYKSNYLVPKIWTYLREHQEIKESKSSNDSFRISTGIRRPRHVFIWAVPTLSYTVQRANIFNFPLDKIGGPPSNSFANNGTKAVLKAPSAKRRLKRFGKRNAA